MALYTVHASLRNYPLLVDVHLCYGDLLIIKVGAYFVNIYRASRPCYKKIIRSPKFPNREILDAQHLSLHVHVYQKSIFFQSPTGKS